MAEWSATLGAEAPAWISVNVSAHQLAEAGFDDIVTSALREAGVPANHLILEMTETGMISDDDALEHSLRKLKSIGVRIAIDDFGTGYSSLAYLRRLPIDVLKIDKTFIAPIDAGPEDAALALAILKIAQGMGLTCIAEGVERDGQLSALRDAGCDLAQGYLISRPMDAAHIDTLLSGVQRPGRRGRVLLVDTDGSCSTLTDLLRRSGFHSVVATTTVGAIEALMEGNVDLAILSLPIGHPDVTRLTVSCGIPGESGAIPLLALHDRTEPRRWTVANQTRRPAFGELDLIDNVYGLLSTRSA
jgi:EAL domain-containing protein (putative c-di-GMP-specific phosphodiesterase class I)